MSTKRKTSAALLVAGVAVIGTLASAAPALAVWDVSSVGDGTDGTRVTSVDYGTDGTRVTSVGDGVDGKDQ